MRRVIPLFFASLSIAGLTYLLTQSNVMREQVAPFLFRLTMILRALLLSTPDIVYWSLFCILMLLIAITTAFRLLTIWLDESDAPPKATSLVPSGSVQRYAEWIESAQHGVFFRRQLARDLAIFSFQVMQRPESGITDLDAAIVEGRIELGSDVAAYLRQGTARTDHAHGTRLADDGELAVDNSGAGLLATVEMLEAQLGIEPPEEEEA